MNGEHPINIWERLLDYREELVDVCDRVSSELDTNRRRREQWHTWTAGWKRRWLEQTSDNTRSSE